MSKLFRGAYTAIITPFKSNESIDYGSFEHLVRRQISQGIDGIVVCGTTGESPTLSHKEHSKLIRSAVNFANGSVPIIAGTGSNCTKEAIDLSRRAQHDGANALLLVNPYYNKPTQEGLYRHFKAISDSVNIPVILYNIKGRTGVNLETPTLLRLIDSCENIVGIKEASGDLNQIREVINSNLPEYFSVLSGDDKLTLDVIKYGGDGVISVVSNLLPKKVRDLVHAGLEGRMGEAEIINSNISHLSELCFIETNPIPIKYILSKEGFCEEIYRLPLCELRPKSKELIDEYFSKDVSRN